jgi:hypothetical protein
MAYQDLAEHSGALVGLLAAFAGLSGVLFWRMFARVEAKLDEMLRLCCECQREQAERFVYRDEFHRERESLWGALNSHGHSQDGRVAR